MKNKPYVKIWNDKKELTNPITKNKPYIHLHESQSIKKRNLKNVTNNKKGIRLIVTQIEKGVFIVYKITKQLIFENNIYQKIKGKKKKILVGCDILKKPIVITHFHYKP